MTATAKKPPEETPEPASRPEDAVLELHEFVAPKRPTVVFQTDEEREQDKPGTVCEVKVPQEFDIEEEQQYRSELGEYTELMQKRDLNKAQRAKLKARLNYLYEKVLIAPAEVKAKFNDRQKQQVIALFTTSLLTEDATAVENALPMMMGNMARIGSTIES